MVWIGAVIQQIQCSCFLVQVWDLRQTKVAYTLLGHMDTVTGLSVSPDGQYLLSNAMDDTGTGTWGGGVGRHLADLELLLKRGCGPPFPQC